VETWDAVRARRNVRAFTEAPIAAEDLERVLEAGRRAPSASNRQPWDFVVVGGRDALIELSQVWRGAGHIAGSAATIVIVAPVTDDDHLAALIEYDVGQATMQMAIVAADLGIGSGHASIGDQEMLRGLLGLPEDRRGTYMLALGYPADRPLRPIQRPARRPFEEVVHRERW
jgi:nitroreductase